MSFIDQSTLQKVDDQSTYKLVEKNIMYQLMLVSCTDCTGSADGAGESVHLDNTHSCYIR